jgi:photosystem II stability/assembly factor-like uncharacterized protein
MDDHRDDVDTWLHSRIDPLPPPPGTFELIKRRARRRRYRQAAASAATVAAVIAAIIVVPRMATSVLQVTPGSKGVPAANGASAPRAAAGGGRTLKASSTPVPTPSGGSQGVSSGSAAMPPVPQDFAPTSVTFVDPRIGWVIGQAGVPHHCSTQYCTSVARTDNAGQTWSGVPAPLTGAPDGSSGVGQIRFLNTSDGWAFGPQLFATHDAGQHWTPIPTGGQRVTDLETVGDRAFAVFASCGGTGPGFASQCTSFSLYSATAGNDSWAPVPGPVTGLGNGNGNGNGGRATSASLVLTGSRGYLLAPGGSLYAGPVDGSGAWQQVGPGPAGGAGCNTGAAQRGGQPSGAMLAAASSSDLVLACAAGSGAGGAKVFTSSDGGHTWQQAGTAPGGGTVTSVAAQPGSEIVIATTAGLDTSHDGGASWQQLEQGPAGPAGGFSYAGMTSTEQGVAVPADPGVHAIWFTFDGGSSWQRSAISN